LSGSQEEVFRAFPQKSNSGSLPGKALGLLMIN